MKGESHQETGNNMSPEKCDIPLQYFSPVGGGCCGSKTLIDGFHHCPAREKTRVSLLDNH